jgi:hypothetical protein
MPKILKNTTGTDITLQTAGSQTIPALGQRELFPGDYTYQWATDDVLAEVQPLLVSGDLVVNDGVNDLSPADGLNFLEYPDTAFNVRFLSDPERVNGFVSKNVQEAIEEAVTGVASVTPTTTTDATPTVAYTFSLADDTAYIFDARIVARRTDSSDYGRFQLTVNVRREGGGAAAIEGCVFQKQAQRTDSGMEVNWNVSGNNVQLLVTGVAAKTIKWQPRVETEAVS